jgi:hypothetical protein
MKHEVMAVSALALSLLGTEVPASEGPSYSGQEAREIKALSESDVSGLLSGAGMGYAKTAELNGYPGPAHVLDLAEELDLTAAQRAETQALFAQMQASARDLGAELVAVERALDESFRDRTIDDSSLTELVARIGHIESRLRAVHLTAHLRQTQILSEHQVARYMVLRGYGGGEHRSRHEHHHGG